MIRWLGSIVICVGVNSVALAARPTQRFAGFDKLSDKVVAVIGSAKRRVWLVSSFMSDYDISLALYLAAVRKLDVRVVLGQERAQEMLSQYDYLRAQQVVVRLATAIGTTVLICDDRMYRINSELDFLSERRNLVLRHVARPDIKAYALALGVVDSPVHGSVYDYSHKRHQQPDHISRRLPRQTIHTRNRKSSGGSS